jgi:hypothetical protein
MTTANKVPRKWAEFHRDVLLKAIGKTPLITLSYKPLGFGKNLLQIEYGLMNLYKQLLRGAKEAKTEYIAVAEDDVLYDKSHFELRPPEGKMGYNMNRWAILTWGKPFYFHKPCIANAGIVTSRDLFIEAWESRFNKYGDKMPPLLFKEAGRRKYEKHYGVKVVPTADLYSLIPILCFSHTNSIDPTQRKKKKRVWPVQAYDIPGWGRAEDIVKKFV